MDTDRPKVSFTLNGGSIKAEAEGGQTLLDYLRFRKGLTGTKNGCGQGYCGTCTVLLNGKPVKSCRINMDNRLLEGAAIETIEGLSCEGGKLHPIQEAFINAGALQCGFCTPGMILTAKSLLDSNPSPDKETIIRYMSSRNICRCTGYQQILEAVEEAGRIMRGEAPLLAGLEDDASLLRRDALGRTTGVEKYADDIVLDGMLYGKVLFAGKTPAVLETLDLKRALALPGVVGAVTAEDIPGSPRIGMVNRDQPALVAEGGKIRSVSDPLCVVFAEEPDLAVAARRAVSVRYRSLPGIYTMDEALASGAPLVWEEKPGNIFYTNKIERGDIGEELDHSDIVVEGIFNTSRIVHGFLEPESGYAKPDGNGGVEVFYPTQTVFDDQIQISEVLGIPKEKVRVVQLPIGGAFGGKEDVILQHLLALAAVKFNRPVKISLSRDESLQVTQKKHPTRFKARLGLDKDGRFRGLQAEILTDKGAYGTLGVDIIENMMAFIGGPYFIPALKIEGCSVYTNNVMSGAMRGFGANQSNFVIESLIDMAAVKLNMDPYNIRLLNVLKSGFPTVTNHVLEPGLPGAEEVIRMARSLVEKEDVPDLPEGMVLGFGFACGVKNVGFGHSLPESAGTRIEMSSSGRCRLYVTHHEYGQGAVIGQTRIAADVLGIPLESIEVQGPDTAFTPYTGATTASRQTFLSGNATLGACRNLRSEILVAAAERLDILDPATLVFDGDCITDRDSGKSLPLSELGQTFSAEFRSFAPTTEGFPGKGEKSIYGDPDFHSRRTHWGYSYGAQACWVGVDKKSGKIKVLKIVTVSDVGKILNKRAVAGQQAGGVMMGVGYALSEEYRTTEGRGVDTVFRNCGLPSAGDMPEIIHGTVEVPHPWGPLGVKGFAEAPSLATAPAIANAVFDAVGIRMYGLPMKPDRIKGEIHESDH